MRGRTLAVAGAALAIAAGGGVAYAATTTVRANCSPQPAVTYGQDVASIRVTCSVPLPPPVTVTSTVTSTVTVTASPTTTASPSPTTTEPTSSPTTTTPAPPPTQPAGWPDAASTGHNGTLLAYDGPCTLTSAVTIDSRDVKAKCDALLVQAMGVIITNSRLPRVESTYRDGASSVTITDSTVEAGAWSDGAVWGYNIRLERSEVTGGQHSVHANDNVTVVDSWLHGQHNPAGQAYHTNAFITNGGSNMVVRGNTLHCDSILNSTDGGCTADVSLFGDFDPVTNVTVERNLLKANASSISYCAYGGHQPSKAYPVATGIVYRDNVFERGSNGRCGVYGPVTSFDPTASGNVWSGNTWDDGTPLNP